MGTPIERLAELVRQAESKARAQKISAEIGQAAEQLRAAEERARRAETRTRAVRPLRLRELQQVESDEQQLKELIKKAAQFKSLLEPGNEAEELILTAQT